MADPVSIVLVAVIVGSVLFLAWYTAQRDWNVDRSADARRDEDEAMPLISEDEEEG